MIWFIVGLLLGLFNGMFIMAIMKVSSINDNDMEEYYEESNIQIQQKNKKH